MRVSWRITFVHFHLKQGFCFFRQPEKNLRLVFPVEALELRSRFVSTFWSTALGGFVVSVCLWDESLIAHCFQQNFTFHAAESSAHSPHGGNAVQCNTCGALTSAVQSPTLCTEDIVAHFSTMTIHEAAFRMVNVVFCFGHCLFSHFSFVWNSISQQAQDYNQIQAKLYFIVFASSCLGLMFALFLETLLLWKSNISV